MNRVVVHAHAVAHEARVRTLLLLREGPLCACDVAAVLRLEPTSTTRHLAVLRRAGLVTTERHGRWDTARLATAAPGVAATLAWIEEGTDPGRAREDRERLREVLQIPDERRCGSAAASPRARRAEA